MKFNTTLVAAFISITAQALALPLFHEKRAGSSPVVALEGAVGVLSSASGVDIHAITGLIATFPDKVFTQAVAIANINVHLGNIAHEFTIAGQAVLLATTGALVHLDTINIQALVILVGQVNTINTNIQISIHNEFASLPSSKSPLPSFKHLINRSSAILVQLAAQFSAIQLAIPLLVNPLHNYAILVQDAVGTSASTSTGLSGVINSLTVIVNNLLTSLGIGTITGGAGGTLLSGLTGGSDGSGLLSGLTGGVTGSGGVLSGLTGGVTGGSSGSGLLSGLTVGVTGGGGLLSDFTGGVTGGSGGSRLLSRLTGGLTGGSKGSGLLSGLTGGVTGTGVVMTGHGDLLGSGGLLGSGLGVHINTKRQFATLSGLPGLPGLPAVPDLPLGGVLATVGELLATVIGLLKGIPAQPTALVQMESTLEGVVGQLGAIPT